MTDVADWGLTLESLDLGSQEKVSSEVKGLNERHKLGDQEQKQRSRLETEAKIQQSESRT